MTDKTRHLPGTPAGDLTTGDLSAVDLAALSIAVLIPCYNEEIAIATVINDFRAALPAAKVWVYDNNSTDQTVAAAHTAGAEVGRENRRGKGHVVRRMFADVEADIYVLVDGDDTYHAGSVGKLISALVHNHLDMVNGARATDIPKAYRPGHRFGNWMLTALMAIVFGREITDMLSGYRVFSRRFVKSFPALSDGFEIETELTVHALELRMPVAEITTPYKDRPEGSVSKLNTIRDGIRILRTLISLVKEERPLSFFMTAAAAFALISLTLATPLFWTFLETGTVPRLPTAVLSTGLMVLASLSVVCGLLLETASRSRREAKRMFYLAMPAVRKPSPPTTRAS